MGRSLAVPVAVRVGRQHQPTQTRSAEQAEPQGRHYHRQVVEVEQPEQHPVRTGEQVRHPQAEPDRVEAVARATPQAQAGQAVTVESVLVAVVVVVVSLAVLAVEVAEAKSL